MTDSNPERLYNSHTRLQQPAASWLLPISFKMTFPVEEIRRNRENFLTLVQRKRLSSKLNSFLVLKKLETLGIKLIHRKKCYKGKCRIKGFMISFVASDDKKKKKTTKNTA